MMIKSEKYALAAARINGRRHVVEIASGPNTEGALLCTTGGKSYLIHGSKLKPITTKAVEILRNFAVSTATKTSQTKS